MKLTYAFCTYRRAARLPRLFAEIQRQECPLPFEILAVNNNSPDKTDSELARLCAAATVPARHVTEVRPGIVHARNRAIEEALDSDILVFIDDDELPRPGLLAAACNEILEAGADCVGGAIAVDFAPHARPAWLGDELLGFLAEVDHGPRSFRVRDMTTPIWTSNVAYRMSIFREQPTLRFDRRYNRAGEGVGGGEDAAMLQRLLESGCKIHYCPHMVVDHFIEAWRLHRRYFLRLHFRSGAQYGMYELGGDFPTIGGVPRFLFGQFLGKAATAVLAQLAARPGAVRAAMNAAYELGVMWGARRRAQGYSDA